MYYTTEWITTKLVQHTYRNTVFIVVVSFLHCLSASCAARPTSLAETYVREEIEELHKNWAWLVSYWGRINHQRGIQVCSFPFIPARTKMKITVYWEVLYSTEYLTIGWLESLHLDWVFFCIRKYEKVLLNAKAPCLFQECEPWELDSTAMSWPTVTLFIKYNLWTNS